MKSIDYNAEKKTLLCLNQLLLPHQTMYIQVHTVEDGWNCIRNMNIRGAPAIAILAMLSLSVELHKYNAQSIEEMRSWINNKLEYLKQSRPTAVNLFEACNRCTSIISQGVNSVSELRIRVTSFAESMLEEDVASNMRIGKFGADLLSSLFPGQLNLLTHCNTGSLATAGYGTALGVVRSLNERNKLKEIFCTETRPYNQGSRLTAYELVADKLPGATLIADSMASFLFATKRATDQPINAVVVGADRIAANGDTANKIGTYQLAISAKHHGVYFVVAAPTTSIDLSIADGLKIPVEERKSFELTKVKGYSKEYGKHVEVQTAPEEINVWNPGFDITPAYLIDAIITEHGAICRAEGAKEFDLESFFKSHELIR